MPAHHVRSSPLLAPLFDAEARRLAMIFVVVYFAQGMWSLPEQSITFVLKERFDYTATNVATLFSITSVAWLLKPAYGLLSDALPLFGRRRKSYFLLSTAFAAAAGFALSALPVVTPRRIAALFALMGLGFAITDVLVDALMVEHGKRPGLTGGFQAVQWAAIYGASVIVGVAGGALTERGLLHLAFGLAAVFPLVSFVLGLCVIREPRIERRAGQLATTWVAIRGSLGSRDLWVVAGFISLWGFSPSIGTPLFYYQTDTLKFSQQFIGVLSSLTAAGAIAGALAYGGLSRRWPLRHLFNAAIGLGVAATLAYLAYTDRTSAITIDVANGVVSTIAMLAFLDLAARACPRQAEGTFFALLMSVYNAGLQGSEIVGSRLYDVLGYTALIWISAGTTALCWILVPWVPVERVQEGAGEPRPESGGLDATRRTVS